MGRMLGDRRGSPLRFAYLGRSTDLFAHAFEAAHTRRGQSVQKYESIAQLTRSPAPDVVVLTPLAESGSGVCGTCNLASWMRSSTLFVVVVDDGSRSEAMALAHVRAGRCHPRVLLYVPGEAGRSDADVLAVIEQAASGPPRTGLAGVLPHHLELDLVQDLGELMAARKPFARLLYAAATTEWSEWGDLGRKLHYSVGVPRNINVDLGEALRRAAIISDNSPWSQPRLAQFAAEHRRFIVAFATGHLAFESHVEAA